MIRIESDPDACRQLWAGFSPGRDAWDDWDLIYAFHHPESHRFRFMVHQDDGGQDNGLLPLVYDSSNDRHMLMGGSYPDGRILWLRHADFPAFFAKMPERTALFDLADRYVSELLAACPQFEAYFGESDFRYYLLPASFDYDFHHHIDTFPPDKRQKFLYDLRHIRKRDPVLRWSDDDEADLFIDLVNRNFGEESDYNGEEDANEVRRVVAELKRSGRLKTLTIEIEGSKQAASLSLVHGSKMVALYSASNNDYNNRGKLLNFETIQEGCRLRVDEISYMTGMQWKANWKMSGETCRTMRNPPAPW